jgi:hypothetical protein
VGLDYKAAVTINATFLGQSAVDQAKKSFNTLNGSVAGIKGNLSEFTTALKTLAVALGVREVVSYGKSILDMGENLLLLKQKTGIGVQTLSDLEGRSRGRRSRV